MKSEPGSIARLMRSLGIDPNKVAERLRQAALEQDECQNCQAQINHREPYCTECGTSNYGFDEKAFEKTWGLPLAQLKDMVCEKDHAPDETVGDIRDLGNFCLFCGTFLGQKV